MKKNKRRTQTTVEVFYQYFRMILNLCMYVYMLLILVVMPLYNEEGLLHIGTDKATFLRKCIIYGSRIILPVLAITAILGVTVYLQSERWERKSMGIKEMLICCKKHLSPTDCFALLYAVSVEVSYLLSDYKDEALWGTTSWYMGMVQQVAVVTMYFLISRAWKRKDWLPALVIPVSAIVFILGYLNRFGIYPIDMRIEQPNFISTIGNINWFCCYLVSIFFGVMLLFWKAELKNTRWKALIMAYMALGFATLVTQGSSSGIVVMAVMFLVFFGMSVSDGKRMETFWLEMIIFSVACLLTCVLRVAKLLSSTYPDTLIDLFTYSILPVIMTIVAALFFVWVRSCNQKGSYPEKLFNRLACLVCGGSAALLGLYIVLLVINTATGGAITNAVSPSLAGVFTFSPKWGSMRGATWSAGWMCFAEQDLLHKLVGVGPDCMSAFLYDRGSEALRTMVNESFLGARLTNAHNEWLTILVNMGLLGFVGYVGMIVTAIKGFLSKQNISMIAGACGICVLAYTINNMFSFQQSLGMATIFVILGIGENYRRSSPEQ